MADRMSRRRSAIRPAVALRATCSTAIWLKRTSHATPATDSYAKAFTRYFCNECDYDKCAKCYSAVEPQAAANSDIVATAGFR